MPVVHGVSIVALKNNDVYDFAIVVLVVLVLLVAVVVRVVNNNDIVVAVASSVTYLIESAPSIISSDVLPEMTTTSPPLTLISPFPRGSFTFPTGVGSARPALTTLFISQE